MKGKNQLLQGMTGSFENLTVTRARDGDAIVKGKITQTTDAKSATQLAQRGIFAAVIAVGSLLLPHIRRAFVNSQAIYSRYNEFTKQALDAGRAGITDVATKTTEVIKDELMPLINFTYGGLYPLNPVFNAGLSSDLGNGKVETSISWNYDAASVVQDGTDRVEYIAFNPETDEYFTLSDGVIRDDGGSTTEFNIPSVGKLYVCAFARSASPADDTKLRKEEVSTETAFVAINPDGTFTPL